MRALTWINYSRNRMSCSGSGVSGPRTFWRYIRACRCMVVWDVNPDITNLSVQPFSSLSHRQLLTRCNFKRALLAKTFRLPTPFGPQSTTKEGKNYAKLLKKRRKKDWSDPFFICIVDGKVAHLMIRLVGVVCEWTFVRKILLTGRAAYYSAGDFGCLSHYFRD